MVPRDVATLIGLKRLRPPPLDTKSTNDQGATSSSSGGQQGVDIKPTVVYPPTAGPKPPSTPPHWHPSVVGPKPPSTPPPRSLASKPSAATLEHASRLAHGVFHDAPWHHERDEEGIVSAHVAVQAKDEVVELAQPVEPPTDCELSAADVLESDPYYNAEVDVAVDEMSLDECLETLTSLIDAPLV